MSCPLLFNMLPFLHISIFGENIFTFWHAMQHIDLLEIIHFHFSMSRERWYWAYLHKIIQPCALASWPWNMSIIFCGPLQQSGNIRLLFLHSGWNWKFGWNYAPNTMCKNYCSSYVSSLKTMFILVLSSILLSIDKLTLKILKIFTIFLNATFIVRTGVSFFLFFEFLPMKVR